MATNQVQEGVVIEWTNGSGSAVSSGDFVLLNSNRAGVALVDIANGATGSIAIDEVYSITKKTGAGETLAVGQLVYLSANGGTATQSSAGTTALGFAVTAATSAATSVNVKLNG